MVCFEVHLLMSLAFVSRGVDMEKLSGFAELSLLTICRALISSHVLSTFNA